MSSVPRVSPPATQLPPCGAAHLVMALHALCKVRPSPFPVKWACFSPDPTARSLVHFPTHTPKPRRSFVHVIKRRRSLHSETSEHRCRVHSGRWAMAHIAPAPSYISFFRLGLAVFIYRNCATSAKIATDVSFSFSPALCSSVARCHNPSGSSAIGHKDVDTAPPSLLACGTVAVSSGLSLARYHDNTALSTTYGHPMDHEISPVVVQDRPGQSLH
jgi:hypothetical protein